MPTLYRIDLTKAHLDRIPHDERVFYLMASQLSNDLNVLAKLLWFASNHPADDDVRTRVGTVQELLIIKMMAGRLHEGRVLLNKAFSAKRLWGKYKNDLSPKGRESFEQINRYFGRPNIVEKDSQQVRLPSRRSCHRRHVRPIVTRCAVRRLSSF